jgi:hypothetical protein
MSFVQVRFFIFIFFFLSPDTNQDLIRSTNLTVDSEYHLAKFGSEASEMKDADGTTPLCVHFMTFVTRDAYLATLFHLS